MSMSFLIQAIIIFLISLYTFLPSFNLGLFGDDWVSLWMYMRYFGPGAIAGETNYFTYFLSGYGPYEITMGLLYKFFGLNDSIYYIFSYAFRLLAAFAVWPLIFYLTRSKLASFYGSLFLSITTIGLETTNWVFNLTSYLAIANLALFLLFFVKSREETKPKLFIFAAAFFYLAHIFAPIRMTGLLPFTLILEIFLNLRSTKINKSSFFQGVKLSLWRLLVIFILFFVITTSGTNSRTNPTKILGGGLASVGHGINTSISLLQQNKFMFLFNPIIMTGEMIIPDIYFSSLSNKINLQLLIGILILTCSAVLIKFTKGSKLSIAFFISTFWIILSFILNWFRDPEVLFPTEYRYFIPTAIGFTVFFGAIIGLGKQFKSRVKIFLAMLTILILHLITTRNYFIDAINIHGAEASDKIWSSFPYFTNLGTPDQPLVFYFKSAPEKQRLVFSAIHFGLPYHMALLYEIYDTQAYYKMPVPMGENEWEQVVSAVTDGKSLVSRQFPEKPIPVDNIYAFFLASDNNLIDITTETRNKLTEELRQ